MKLSALLADLDGVPALGAAAAIDVVSATVDSRRVTAGALFVAAPGATPSSRDGHDFIDRAVAAGAVAVLAERAAVASVPVIVVADARRVGAIVSERLLGSPSSRLRVCGVTGTNGKTTVTTLLAHIATSAGARGAVVGTLGVGPPDAPRATGFTTPEAEDTARALRGLADDGFDVVGMEVSSHALATRRADGVRFAAVAFTNLTHDHLDFHGTLEAYLAAKTRLFSALRAVGTVALIPARRGADDAVHDALAAAAPDAWTWTAGDGDATIRALDVATSADGLRFTLAVRRPGEPEERAAVHCPHLLGAFNVENAVVAAGLALAAGLSCDAVAQGLAAARPPRGRMERVTAAGTTDGPLVVVDYAHTPDALERALLCARGFCSGRLIAVFGCGGDRDATKRPVMGAIADALADLVIVTDDNSRSERGDDIVDAIAGGIQRRREVQSARELSAGTWLRQRDRRRAIWAAVRAAEDGDVVVIAGKGHEATQLDGATRLPFDDRREAEGALLGRPRPAFLPRAFVEGVLGVVPALPTALTTFLGVSTDSRAVEPGALFVALTGDSFDGHAFVEASIRGGAAAAVVARGSAVADRAAELPLFVVDDPLKALQTLAGTWLAHLPTTRVGLTGSNGKTTTKELLAAALRRAIGDDVVVATFGNLNNHIGVPLTALTVEAHHEVAILEMGMNHLGEIASYCVYAAPTVGLVTNMGTAHAGNVGGVEGVAQAKAELFLALPPAGVAIVNADDPRCVREAQNKSRARQLFFGSAPYADVRLENVTDVERGGQLLTLRHGDVTVEVTLALDGRHNAQNAAGAVAAAVAVGADFREAALGLADAHAAHGRLERRTRADGLLILDDSYNANPDSMEVGLETLQTVGRGRERVAVLGEMRELGSQAAAAHRHIGAAAAQSGVSALWCCGAFAAEYEAGARAAGLKNVAAAPNSTALAPLVAASVRPEMVLLIKGSRGARMERVVDALLAQTAAKAED